MLALVLALSSSLCWGCSDLIGGVQARRVPLLRVMLVSQSVGLVGLCALIAARGAGPPGLAALAPAAGAGVAGIVALSAFYRALAIGTMSIVAPISATGVAVPVIVGVATGERPAALQLVGILTALAGIVLVSREPAAEGGDAGTVRASVALALVAALGFGSFFVGLRISARTDVLWALFASRAAGIVVLVVAGAAGLRHARSQTRRAAGLTALLALLAIGVLDLSANGLYALATRHGLLSVVAVAPSLYPLVHRAACAGAAQGAGASRPGAGYRRRPGRRGADRRRLRAYPAG